MNNTPNIKNASKGDLSSGSSSDLRTEIYENSTNKTPQDPKGWQSPEGHTFQRAKISNDLPKGEIVKVNGQEAFSKAAGLYKGIGSRGEFWQDPKIDGVTGKVPPGKPQTFEYPTYVGPREHMGLSPYPRIGRYDCHPIISPEASYVSDTTVCPDAIHTTWRDLRTQLGRGAGVRTNKFLLEMTLPIFDGVTPWKLNVLCKSTSFPQRQMNTASMWRFGRKYNLRGETNFGDTWTLVFEDDSSLELRKKFDHWFRDIDDSRLQFTGLNVYQNLGNPLARLHTLTTDLYEREETSRFNIGGILNGAATSLLRPEYAPSAPNYQTDIRVYQLDQTGNKVMGYVMQNAFVSDIGSVEYADDKQNELVSFPVTFTYSEFLPLKGNVLDGQIRIFD